jgi:hypothetical protein
MKKSGLIKDYCLLLTPHESKHCIVKKKKIEALLSSSWLDTCPVPSLSGDNPQGRSSPTLAQTPHPHLFLSLSPLYSFHRRRRTMVLSARAFPLMPWVCQHVKLRNIDRGSSVNFSRRHSATSSMAPPPWLSLPPSLSWT